MGKRSRSERDNGGEEPGLGRSKLNIEVPGLMPRSHGRVLSIKTRFHSTCLNTWLTELHLSKCCHGQKMIQGQAPFPDAMEIPLFVDT